MHVSVQALTHAYDSEPADAVQRLAQHLRVPANAISSYAARDQIRTDHLVEVAKLLGWQPAGDIEFKELEERRQVPGLGVGQLADNAAQGTGQEIVWVAHAHRDAALAQELEEPGPEEDAPQPVHVGRRRLWSDLLLEAHQEGGRHRPEVGEPLDGTLGEQRHHVGSGVPEQVTIPGEVNPLSSGGYDRAPTRRR